MKSDNLQMGVTGGNDALPDDVLPDPIVGGQAVRGTSDTMMIENMFMRTIGKMDLIIGHTI